MMMDPVEKLGVRLDRHLDECERSGLETTRVLNDLVERHTAVEQKLDKLNETAWRVVGAICLVVFTAGVALFVQSYNNHADTVAKTENSQAQIINQMKQ